MDVPVVKVTQEELNDLGLALEKVWQLDVNRLEPGTHYTLDLQEGKFSREEGDYAPDPLFSWVDESVLERPTFKAFINLLDNYEAETGVAEQVTREEIQENHEFLNAVLKTKPIQYAQKYLAKKGLISESPAEFKRTLWDLWFKLYRRDTQGDSSAFEHVFVGEFRGGKVIGFHNWITYYLAEKRGEVDYQGFILPRKRGRNTPPLPTGEEHVLNFQFKWQGELKPVTTSFIGVSPEFELAIYTMCFFAGEEDNYAFFDDVEVNLKCHSMGENRMGSCYPMAVQ